MTADQVVVVDGNRVGGESGPPRSANPQHPEYETWMDAHGHRMLAATQAGT